MLPDINAQQRAQAGRSLQRILIGGRRDDQTAVGLVVSEPSPSAALDRHRAGRHGLLQALHRAVLGIDHALQVARRSLSTTFLGRSKVLPEDTVVQVTASIELDILLQRNDLGRIILSNRISELLISHVEIGDVCRMVLGVVDLHDLRGDERLELTVVVGQVRHHELATRHAPLDDSLLKLLGDATSKHGSSRTRGKMF